MNANTINSITAWFNLITLALQFGEKAVEIGIRIYHKVEEEIKAWKASRPDSKKGEVSMMKRAMFDGSYIGEITQLRGEEPKRMEVDRIRQGVWKFQLENRKKNRLHKGKRQ